MHQRSEDKGFVGMSETRLDYQSAEFNLLSGVLFALSCFAERGNLHETKQSAFHQIGG
ncbi:hypothetical protein EDF68_1174 [Ochrobactrum sp. BH3]|nr:hypothetical protein EDF68_1174 [Ochrobactrum sp. BH3]